MKASSVIWGVLFLYLNSIFFLLLIMYMNVYLYVCATGVKMLMDVRGIKSLELKLEAVVSCPTRMLRTNSGLL